MQVPLDPRIHRAKGFESLSATCARGKGDASRGVDSRRGPRTVHRRRQRERDASLAWQQVVPAHTQQTLPLCDGPRQPDARVHPQARQRRLSQPRGVHAELSQNRPPRRGLSDQSCLLSLLLGGSVSVSALKAEPLARRRLPKADETILSWPHERFLSSLVFDTVATRWYCGRPGKGLV